MTAHMKQAMQILRIAIKQALCKHNYQKTGFTQAEDNHVRFSMRAYTCMKCGKTRIIDGRYDPYIKSKERRKNQ